MNPRGARRWAVAIVVLLAALLAGCPDRSAPAPSRTPVARSSDTVSAPAVVDDHTESVFARKPAPPKGGPLPPQRVIEPVQIDRSCHADADCVIKDVGSCCGAFPSCVNRNSPTDPGAVEAACEKNGAAAHCSRRVLEQCACRQGQCVAAGKTPVGGWVDDAPSAPDPSR